MGEALALPSGLFQPIKQFVMGSLCLTHHTSFLEKNAARVLAVEEKDSF